MTDAVIGARSSGASIAVVGTTSLTELPGRVGSARAASGVLRLPLTRVCDLRSAEHGKDPKVHTRGADRSSSRRLQDLGHRDGLDAGLVEGMEIPGCRIDAEAFAGTDGTGPVAVRARAPADRFWCRDPGAATDLPPDLPFDHPALPPAPKVHIPRPEFRGLVQIGGAERWCRPRDPERAGIWPQTLHESLHHPSAPVVCPGVHQMT